MRKINKAFLMLAKRAEKLKTAYLVKSFVDVGPTYTLLSSTDNQIMFGRRGTGKTHFLSVLNNDITKRGVISVSIDMRLIGSTGGIFSDLNIPLSERATRLLSDTLCIIHENILDYTFNNDLENTAEISSILNDFIDQATELSIIGTKEEEASISTSLEKQVSLSASFSNNIFSPGFNHTKRDSNTENEKNKTSGKEILRVHFGSITSLLNKLIGKLPHQELWILIDEWSEVPLELQPYLAELLRRILFPIPGITVKIAAIAHRCNFMESDSKTFSSIGIELGSDASSVINLDEYMVFDNDSSAAKDFFKKLLYRHVTAIDETLDYPDDNHTFINDIFSQTSSFDEYVRAVEGVPRDAINIIAFAAQHANENKISISNIRHSAQRWFQVNKHSALNSRPEAVSLLDKIINEVIGHRKSRGFLLSNEKSHPLIDYLYDMRVIHVLKQGVSARSTVGKKYTLYTLDYGCYVELMSSKNAPLGLIIDCNDNNELQYIEIPKSDYRSVRNSILDLDDSNGQLRLNLIDSSDKLQLPEKQHRLKKTIEKSINEDFLNSIPNNIGIKKIGGTIYIPIILVALVLRKAKGYNRSYAAELTKLINEHIIITLNRPKIATNNLSRELRNKKILQLPWLDKHVVGSRTLFSLNDHWKFHWQEYFGIDAPNI